MKLWEKGKKLDKSIEEFTSGRDRDLDLYLAPYDVIGSMAHAIMLESIGILKPDELPNILDSLKKIYKQIGEGRFIIEESTEDVHSQVEAMLTNDLGDLGKKIHTGRSRNDQVLLDLKLFMRDEIRNIVELTGNLTDTLVSRSEENKNVLLPGYTHLQVAMPSSFGLWFGAYAESLTDDLLVLQSAFHLVNRNPLGSAAGYGSSFPLNRELTTRLLGFESMNYNVVYAQMGRGRTEKIVSFALGNIASTLAKFATDVCLFMSQNFAFVTLPDELTTGSSIMPHKKNPDVFELTRARCNKLSGLTTQIMLVTANLPSGYFRDLQVLKEIIIPAFEELSDCLKILDFSIKNLKVNRNILDNKIYDYLFSVEEVNKLVLNGVPFREAYRIVGDQIESGTFNPEKKLDHTHEGSMGNLCLDEIIDRKKELIEGFGFSRIESAISALLN
jgi:argininosuccinate lyase